MFIVTMYVENSQRNLSEILILMEVCVHVEHNGLHVEQLFFGGKTFLRE